MTYAENVQRLLNRERFNLGLHNNNTQQEINNINKREKENIANIEKAATLLIGKPGQNFEQGKKNKWPVEGQGILPYMYGRKVGKDIKEADEAFEEDRKEQLEKLAVLEAQLKANKNLDTEMHKQKLNLLLNGAYYEDADRFTQLSPHGQTQYAKRKLQLFNDSLELKAKNYLAKSEDLLNVNGHEYTPKSVSGIPLYPIALKEHALNVAIDKIRTQSGINGFSEEMLELAGVTGPDGTIETTKNSIMGEFRTQHGIDSSYQTRIKAMQEFTSEGDYDLNRLLTIFTGTWNDQGRLMTYDEALTEAFTLLGTEMVHGKLKGDFGFKVLEKIGEQINPVTNTPFKDANKVRFDKLIEDVKNGRFDRTQADLKEGTQKQKQTEVNFNKWVKREIKKDQNFTMSQAEYEWWIEEYQGPNGGNGIGIPQWLSNRYFQLTKDDEEEIKRIKKIMAADEFDEYTLKGANHRVINYFMQPQGGNATSKVEAYNTSGGGYINKVLKDGGEYNLKLIHIVREASNQTTLSTKDMKWNPRLWDGMNRMEKDFREKYELYLSKNPKGGPSVAAQLAYEDVQAKSGIMISGKVSPLKQELGDKWTGVPLNDSEYFKVVPVDRKAVFAEGKEVDVAYEWAKEEGDDGKVWNTKFFETAPIPGSKEHLDSALSYYRGETNGQVPLFWKQLANKFQGISALDLMKWQIRANYGSEMTDERIEALNPQKINTVDTACLHPDVVELNRFMNYKSTPGSELQAKCAVNEYREMIRDEDGHLTISENTAAAESEAILAAPRHREAVIPEGAEYNEESGFVKEVGSISQIEAGRYWTGNYNVGDTRTIRGETQTLQEDGKTWKSENDLIEDEVNQKGWVKSGNYQVSDVERKTADVPEEIINAYGGGHEGRSKYLAAKQRYETEQNKIEFGYGLGVSSGIHGSGATRIENRAIPGKNFDELTLEDHNTLYNEFWWESKIDENWFTSTFPVMDEPVRPEKFTGKGPGVFDSPQKIADKRIAKNEYNKLMKKYKEDLKLYKEQMAFRGKHRAILLRLEKSGAYNPEIHNYIPGHLQGEIFGIPWSMPSTPGEGTIIPKETMSNLQSMSNSPDSPYLDDSLRILSAQLLVASIGQEVPA
tara:strand:+ start:796 stop:4143 length:3348 start_codon:yes stop_codon:yes gene_type:complete